MPAPHDSTKLWSWRPGSLAFPLAASAVAMAVGAALAGGHVRLTTVQSPSGLVAMLPPAGPESLPAPAPARPGLERTPARPGLERTPTTAAIARGDGAPGGGGRPTQPPPAPPALPPAPTGAGAAPLVSFLSPTSGGPETVIVLNGTFGAFSPVPGVVGADFVGPDVRGIVPAHVVAWTPSQVMVQVPTAGVGPGTSELVLWNRSLGGHRSVPVMFTVTSAGDGGASPHGLTTT